MAHASSFQIKPVIPMILIFTGLLFSLILIGGRHLHFSDHARPIVNTVCIAIVCASVSAGVFLALTGLIAMNSGGPSFLFSAVTGSAFIVILFCSYYQPYIRITRDLTAYDDTQELLPKMVELARTDIPERREKWA